MEGQLTEEQLKNMTPEQLKELQKQNCIFCHIVNGRVQSKKIFEDDKVIAILDINPGNPGHVLLYPKEHYSILPQMPDDMIRHIFMIAKAICNAALRTLECEGANIFVANGVAAGQKAPHFMVHIVPRKEGDNLTGFSFKEIPELKDEQKQIAGKIKNRLDALLGRKSSETVSLDAPVEASSLDGTDEAVDAEIVEEVGEDKPSSEASIEDRAVESKGAASSESSDDSSDESSADDQAESTANGEDETSGSKNNDDEDVPSDSGDAGDGDADGEDTDNDVDDDDPGDGATTKQTSKDNDPSDDEKKDESQDDLDSIAKVLGI